MWRRRKISVVVTLTQGVRNMSAAPQIPVQFERHYLDLSFYEQWEETAFNTLQNYCLAGPLAW